MACSYKLECRSDTGFRREENKEGLIDGRSARGANFLRLGLDENKKGVCHLIDVAVGVTKIAVRSTFTSETHGLIATTDSAIVLATTLHEIAVGPLSLTEAVRLTQEAGLCYESQYSQMQKNSYPHCK